MSFNKGITALAMLALTAEMLTSPSTSAQTSQVDNPDWPLRFCSGRSPWSFATELESTRGTLL